MNKKTNILLAFLLLLSAFLHAQTDNVGIGTTTPDASAALDVQSTEKGMLIPRMTTAERTAITAPATGLLVYDTDTGSFWFWESGIWIEIHKIIPPADVGENDTDIVIPLIGTITSTINLTGPGIISSNTMIEVCLDIIHSTDDQLDIYLESPDGTMINLSSDNGGSANNYTGTCFTTEAVNPITSGSAPFTGEWIPEEPFSNFIGDVISGDWTLTVTDDYLELFGFSNGTLLGWSIKLSRPFPAAVAASLSDADEDTRIQVEESADEDKIRFDVAGNEAMVIGANGNVGIGTDAPASKLDIEGGMSVGAAYSGTTAAPANGAIIEGNVGIGTGAPDASAALDIMATNKGVLIPRVANTAAVSSPASGLLIYDNSSSCFKFFNGTSWTAIGFKTLVIDADGDTRIQVEESTDEDIVRFDLGGTEHFVMEGPRLEIKNSGNSVFIGEGAGENDDLTNNNNVAIGKDALKSNTIGSNNTANGESALRSNVEGHNNTASGKGALYSNTIGGDNTANGTEALYSNTGGNSNTASGRSALRYNTEGDYNTAFGNLALYSNTNGNNNTASGKGALSSNTIGDDNTANGTDALYSNTEGSFNTANGYYALYDNTTGNLNTAIGYAALADNTTGGANTANGIFALYKNTEGSFNIAMGHKVLYNNTTGDLNIANGYQALYYNTIGDLNIANGNQALYNNTIGDLNIANGNEALYNNTIGDLNIANGNDALYYNTDGSYNTAVGHQALYDNTTGEANTAIGYNADVLSSDLIIATAIGYNAEVGCDNCMALGGTGNAAVKVGIAEGTPTADLHIKQSDESYGGSGGIKLVRSASSNNWKTMIYGDNDYVFAYNGVLKSYILDSDGSYVSTSDRRLKKNIAPMPTALSRLMQLKPVRYHFKEVPENTPKSYGFIAQEVKPLFPDVVGEKDGYLSMNYGALGIVAIKAIQEQQEIIEDLHKRNETQQSQIEDLQAQLTEMDKLKAESNAMQQRLARLEAALLGDASSMEKTTEK